MSSSVGESGAPHKNATRRSRWYIPVTLTFAMCLGLTIALFVLMHHWERSANQNDFDYAAKHSVEAIRRAIERIEMVHEIMRQDFYGSSEISAEEFHLMCDPFLAHVPSLKVLQWAPRVLASDRKSFEQNAAALGRTRNYRICTEGPNGELEPVDSRLECFPILFAATRHHFQATYGWDFWSIPALRGSMAKSRDTNSFIVSPPVTFRGSGDRQLVQTFLPVYRDFKKLQSVEERRAQLDGYIVGLCQIDDLVENALKYANGPQGIDMAVLDESLPFNQQLLHYHSSRMRYLRETDPEAEHLMEPVDLHPNGIHYYSSLTFGGRQWTLLCMPAPMFFTPYADWRSWSLLVAGLLVTYVATRYMYTATTKTERIQQLVDQRTHELRQKDEQLRQSQKLEAVGSLAGGIAHEFNNLLQVISGYTRYAMEELKPEDQTRKDLESVLEASDRASSLTRQLLSFSRRQTVDRKPMDANEMVSDLTKMLRPLLGEKVKLKLHLAKNTGIISADAGSFQQVLVNLCLNARDAMPDGGEIIVRTERVNVTADLAEHYADLKTGPCVEISVADTGCGMTPEVRDRIFEPFFTTKAVGQGTGLGLPTVYGIVRQHEGGIHVYSEPGHGSTFKIYLPAIPSDANSADVEYDDAPQGGHETILVAEDDLRVQDVARRILVQNGYTVLTANDGEEAWQMLQQHQEIALVLLDAMMPKRTGHEVYCQIKEDYPTVRVVFCSGYAPETSHLNCIVNEHLPLVEKPYNPDVLLHTIREVLDTEELCQI
jgi:signal transduction histidine kinase/CheY-like chemotaxis protein/sensor domain CHASE-containing protein